MLSGTETGVSGGYRTPVVKFHVRLPIPNIFIFERCNLSDDDGSIMSNMRPKMSFFVFGLAIFLIPRR